MLFNYCGSFVVLLCLGQVTLQADSDGKEFILAFSYPDGPALSNLATASLVIIPNQVDTSCLITYTDPETLVITSLTTKANYSKVNEIQLAVDKVVALITIPADDSDSTILPDPRIFVTCQATVKLIANLNDPFNGWGDTFLVPSTKSAGTDYVFEFPPSAGTSIGYFLVLPLIQKEWNYLDAHVYYDGVEEWFNWWQYDTTQGAFQVVYTAKPQVAATHVISVVIRSTFPVMVSLVSPFASIDKQTPKLDYATYMPLPVNTYKCVNGTEDVKVTATTYTSNLYIASGGGFCNETFNLNIYSDDQTLDGSMHEVDNIGSNQINTTKSTFVGVSSNSDSLRATKFSGFKHDLNDANYFGSTLTYLPSLTEYLNETSQFFALSTKCHLEVTTEQTSTIESQLLIDSTPLQKLPHSITPISLPKYSYLSIDIQIKSYGIHTISLSAPYAATIICPDGLYNVKSYLIGFNIHK
uniref:IgGFc_binding domain-containing protein n=1 Tax=Rhabditophanes sp. KR3021 TaxID=114890 RepID=A0AC35U0X1_9BILA